MCPCVGNRDRPCLVFVGLALGIFLRLALGLGLYVGADAAKFALGLFKFALLGECRTTLGQLGKFLAGFFDCDGFKCLGLPSSFAVDVDAKPVRRSRYRWRWRG